VLPEVSEFSSECQFSGMEVLTAERITRHLHSLHWCDQADARAKMLFYLLEAHQVLALQLPFLQISESMGNHDSKIMDAASVD
jgi:hypothetical protein